MSRKMKMRNGGERTTTKEVTTTMNLENDEKPEPHYPKTQEREQRVKSAFRNINLKMFERDRSSDGRSSAGLSRSSKFRSSVKVGPNHFLSKNDPPMPGNMLERTSTVGYVRPLADKDDVTSVISQAKTMLSDGRLNATAFAYNLQNSMAHNLATNGLTAE